MNVLLLLKIMLPSETKNIENAFYNPMLAHNASGMAKNAGKSADAQ